MHIGITMRWEVVVSIRTNDKRSTKLGDANEMSRIYYEMERICV